VQPADWRFATNFWSYYSVVILINSLKHKSNMKTRKTVVFEVSNS